MKAGIIACMAMALVFSCSAQREMAKASSPAPSEQAVGGEMNLSDVVKKAPGIVPSGSQLNPERKLLREADLGIEALDISKAGVLVAEAVLRAGGYLETSSYSEYNVGLAVRIPSARFDAFLDTVGGIGKLKTKKVSVIDVTRQYIDTESRIGTKKILKERYETYLKQAKNTDDLLSIEKALNDVTSELESVEAQFRSLKGDIDYSVARISIFPPPSVTPQGGLPSFGEGFARLFSSFSAFMYNFFFAFIGILLFGIPILAVLILFWFFLFSGRAGILRKLFVALNGKKKSP